MDTTHRWGYWGDRSVNEEMERWKKRQRGDGGDDRGLRRVARSAVGTVVTEDLTEWPGDLRPGGL